MYPRVEFEELLSRTSAPQRSARRGRGRRPRANTAEVVRKLAADMLADACLDTAVRRCRVMRVVHSATRLDGWVGRRKPIREVNRADRVRQGPQARLTRCEETYTPVIEFERRAPAVGAGPKITGPRSNDRSGRVVRCARPAPKLGGFRHSRSAILVKAGK